MSGKPSSLLKFFCDDRTRCLCSGSYIAATTICRVVVLPTEPVIPMMVGFAFFIAAAAPEARKDSMYVGISDTYQTIRVLGTQDQCVPFSVDEAVGSASFVAVVDVTTGSGGSSGFFVYGRSGGTCK